MYFGVIAGNFGKFSSDDLPIFNACATTSHRIQITKFNYFVKLNDQQKFCC